MNYHLNTSIINLDGEEWKEIAGYDYLISNYGRVKSLPKKATIRKSIGAYRVTKPRIMKQIPHKGYMKVLLANYPNKKQYFVHRLVANAFIHNPENKLEVNHIDCCKHNNSVSNLEWVTSSENYHHAVKMGKNSYKKDRLPKLPKTDLKYKNGSKRVFWFDKTTKKMLGWAISTAEAERYLGINQRGIQKAAGGSRKSCGGYYFSYEPKMMYDSAEQVLLF